MKRGARTGLIVAGGIVALLLVVAVVGVLVLTQTGWGRERVRAFALGQLRNSVAGRVEIGSIDGNLLSGATLTRVLIADSAGNPFLRADSMSLRYSLRSLIGKHIVLQDVVLVNPLIRLDDPPGADWNFARLFPKDTTPGQDTLPGFGSWLRIEDLTVRNGTVLVRSEWAPPDSVRGAARDAAIAAALSEDNRLRIEPVPGGWQSVMRFDRVNAQLPLLRLADPDSANRIIQVRTLSMIARPFRPPPALVRNLVGTVVLTQDSARFQDVRVTLPASEARIDGWYALGGTGAYQLTAASPKLAFEDVRFLEPRLPDGGGMLQGIVTSDGTTTRFVSQRLDVRAEGARVHGSVDVAFGNTLAIGPTDVSFSDVDTELLRRFAPTLPTALRGDASGRMHLRGTPDDLALDGSVVFRERSGSTSRIGAEGQLRNREGTLRADDLRLRFDPLQLTLAEALTGPTPLDGRITGRATLNGPLSERIRADADVRHLASTGTSHITGRADVVFGTTPRFDIDARARTLSLATVGRFAPAAQLHGTASGPVSLRGTAARFTAETQLAVAGGGSIDLRGTFALQAARPRYDFAATLAGFDAAAVSARAPHTRLQGVIAADGSGFDPATMNATVRADLLDLQLGSDSALAMDTTRLQVRIANGLATAERAQIRMGSTRADLEGSFGLVAGRTGELRFDITVDSAGQFQHYLPPADTGLVPPRPLGQQRAIAAARADSLRVATETEVERAATGQPALPELAYDTIRPVRRDSVSGSLHASGVLRGNIHAFDASGTATADHLVVRGNSLARGEARFALAGIGTPNARVELDASADSLRTAGFAFDSASIKGDYVGRFGNGQGNAEFAVFQESDRDYHVATRFILATERSELIFNRLAINLDSAQWYAPHPGSLSWSGSGIELDRIELVNAEGGRILADGRLPTEGEADLRLEVAQLRLGSISALLQDTMQIAGILSLDAQLRGTTRAPRFEGTSALDSALYGGTLLPDLSAKFSYANRQLEATAMARSGEHQLADAEVRLPIDLAFQGVTGSRLLDGPMQAALRADSLPLDALPRFTDQVTEVSGIARGYVNVTGTARDPDVEGRAQLDLGRLRLAASGVRMFDINGVMRFNREMARVDSLIAHARGGEIRVAGTIGIEDLRRPSFDLVMTSDDAQLLDNEHGDIRADADLALTGAFDAPLLEGTMRITGGVIYLPELGARRATPLDLPQVAAALDTSKISGEILARPSPFISNLAMDVALRVARDTWARNTQANVEIYTSGRESLRVQMSRGTNTLRVLGTIAADRGEYTFAGRRFNLNSGTATFLAMEELNPLLQLNGQYAVQQPGREALVIQITVGGVLREPTVTLTSNAQPPLSQSELISYFAFGESSSSLLDLDGSSVAGSGGLSGLSTLAQQQLAGVALGTMTEDVMADLQEEGTRAGLDVFRVHPAPIPAELGFESYFQNIVRGTELEAGKYLTSRLYVGAQARTSNTWPGLRAEYRTSSGFSLESVWEPRYIPAEPTLEETPNANPARSFGTFLYWTRRF